MNGIWKWTKQLIAGSLVLVIALTAISSIAGSSARARLARQNPPPGRLVDLGGFKMHIHCMGEGKPTVILEAGLDDFSILWSQIQLEIAEVTRVCSYDRAGLGWSESSPAPRTGQTMVQELDSLLVHSSIDPPYVMVGHSFGGALTRLYAHTFPNKVQGMVLVDAAPTDLFVRIPRWGKAIDGKLGLYRILASLSSFGLLPFARQYIPDRGMPEAAVDQYRAIAVSTDYFRTGIAESEAFESNLAEIQDANIFLDVMPLIVISRGYWDAMPGFSETENQQAWQAWQEMQSELTGLSSNSRQIIAEQSEHFIQFQQPQLVIDAIKDVVAVVDE